MEQTYNGRAIINDTLGGIEIIIPSKKNWFVIIFLCFWLGGWSMGEIFAITTVIGSIQNPNFGGLFILFWLGGWTVGGYFALSAVLWNLNGKELITFQHGVIELQKKGVLFFKPKSFNLKDAKAFRVQEIQDGGWSNQRNDAFPFNSNGLIRFDYGFKTIKFAANIDEAEAKYILKRLKEKGILHDNNFETGLKE
jgi:hypothetical protein